MFTTIRKDFVGKILGFVISATVAACLPLVANAAPAVVAQADSKAAQSTGNLEGEWNGTLDANGTKLRLVVKIAKTKDGKLTATLDSPDQNATGIPIDSVEQTPTGVKLTLTGIAASYEGKLNADGSQITGDWKQGGGSLPLVLTRAGSKAGTGDKHIGLPATLAGFEDEGAFGITLNEEQIGVVKFSWKKDGSYEDHATIHLAGQTAEVTSRITPDADGRWKQIVIELPTGPVTLTRDGVSVKRTIKDKTTTLETQEGALLYQGNDPALLAQAVRAYDRTRGGAQKFPFLAVTGAPLDATLEAKETAEHTVAGKDLTLTKFLVGLPGIDLYVYADNTGKVYMEEVPAQKAVVIRQGFEGLRKADAADKLLSAPTYEVEIDRGVKVPMRDGIHLSTDIYRPKGVAKAPVILVRTPYKKEMDELQARFYARRGYVFAVQDCRGRFGSEGAWEPFINESKDGYDAVEWLAAQPFSTGKIGMIGGSYLG